VTEEALEDSEAAAPAVEEPAVIFRATQKDRPRSK
jgi:hypothetical protein